jgi:exodeoxyribonuclease V alpha subunit
LGIKTRVKMANNAIGEILEFKGKVESVRYYSEASAWGAIVVSVSEEIPFSKVSFDYDIETNETIPMYYVTVAGKMPEPVVGNTYNIIGQPVHVAKYKSDQYEVVSMFSEAPKTVEDQKAFLSSLCTEKQVESMLSVYPDIVDMVIQGKGEEVDLGLLKGIGEVRWGEIKEKIVENFAISDILSLLVPIGISFSKIKKLLGDEPNPQILKQKLLKNPYVITSISGISFKTADKIAIELNSGLRESEERLSAFISYYLNKLGNDKGHTWVEKEEIRNASIDEVPEVEKFLDLFIEKEIENSKLLHIDGEKIGLKRFYDDEMFIWNTIQKLNIAEPLEVTEEAINEGIRLAEEEQGFSYNTEQRNVIVNMTKSNFTSLRGKAGVGKSTVARGILKIYQQMGYSISVAAFSAKAAVRASETTGMKSSTIHRLLGLGKERSDDIGQQLTCDVLFIDECVLNPLYLMKVLFKAVDPEKTKVILCADTRQLPPLGVGNVFSDIVEKEGLNQNELMEIQRQAAESGIILDANQIRDGISPISFSSTMESRIVRGNKQDLFYIFKEDKEELFRLAVSTFLKSVEEKGIGNVVILVPFRKKSLNSTKEFNRVIQKELNSKNQDNKFVHGDTEFWLSDFVIHTVNNYKKEIFNGFTGFISKIEKNKVFVDYGERTVEYTHDDIGELELAYSLTTWKYQGSEVKDAIVVMDSSHFILLSSQYLYCSLTRAKERALVLSDRFAFQRCLSEDKTIRNTWLKEI